MTAFTDWLNEANNPTEFTDIADSPLSGTDFTQYVSGTDGPQMSVDPDTQTDFTSFLDETSSGTPQWSSDPEMTTDFGQFLSGSQEGIASTGDLAGEENLGVGSLLGQGVSTFNSWMKNIFGGDQKAVNSLYSAAIVAGANAILQNMKSDDEHKYKSQETEKLYDFKNKDREDTQAHETELLTDKYAREDDARARKNKVSTRAGLIQYKPGAIGGYQVPGAASTQQYGILGKA